MTEKSAPNQQPLSKFDRERQALADRSQRRLDNIMAKVKARGEIVEPSPLTVARAECFESRLMDNRKKRRNTNAATAAVLGAISAVGEHPPKAEPAAPEMNPLDATPVAEPAPAVEVSQEADSNVFSEFFGLGGQEPRNGNE